jgi:hypothetical protein
MPKWFSVQRVKGLSDTWWLKHRAIVSSGNWSVLCLSKNRHVTQRQVIPIYGA